MEASPGRKPSRIRSGLEMFYNPGYGDTLFVNNLVRLASGEPASVQCTSPQRRVPGVRSPEYLSAAMFLTDDPAQGKGPEPVVFLESQPVKFPSPAAVLLAAAEKDASGTPVRVRVIAPYRVCREGKPFVGGQTLSVPAATAETWIKSGWVMPVSKKGQK